jgi:hypothetical protein
MVEATDPRTERERDRDRDRDRIRATELDVGDRVFMGINTHGRSSHVPGIGYDRSLYQSGVEATVVEALSEADAAMLDDGDRGRPMADVTVETDDGTRYRWIVESGYVIGPHPDMGRRSDVGRIGGFYTSE